MRKYLQMIDRKLLCDEEIGAIDLLKKMLISDEISSENKVFALIKIGDYEKNRKEHLYALSYYEKAEEIYQKEKMDDKNLFYQLEEKISDCYEKKNSKKQYEYLNRFLDCFEEWRKENDIELDSNYFLKKAKRLLLKEKLQRIDEGEYQKAIDELIQAGDIAFDGTVLLLVGLNGISIEQKEKMINHLNQLVLNTITYDNFNYLKQFVIFTIYFYQNELHDDNKLLVFLDDMRKRCETRTEDFYDDSFLSLYYFIAIRIFDCYQGNIEIDKVLGSLPYFMKQTSVVTSLEHIEHYISKDKYYLSFLEKIADYFYQKMPKDNWKELSIYDPFFHVFSLLVDAYQGQEKGMYYFEILLEMQEEKKDNVLMNIPYFIDGYLKLYHYYQMEKEKREENYKKAISCALLIKDKRKQDEFLKMIEQQTKL